MTLHIISFVGNDICIKRFPLVLNQWLKDDQLEMIGLLQAASNRDQRNTSAAMN